MKREKCDELSNLERRRELNSGEEINKKHLQEKANVMLHKMRGGIQINANANEELCIDGEQP
jgi:hypothetical protein